MCQWQRRLTISGYCVQHTLVSTLSSLFLIVHIMKIKTVLEEFHHRLGLLQ